MRTLAAVLGVLMALVMCGAWFVFVPHAELTAHFEKAPPVAAPGTVRVTRAVPAASPARRSSSPDTAQQVTHQADDSPDIMQARRKITPLASLSTVDQRAPHTSAVALVETLPISGTIRQSDAVQLVRWQAGADAAGYFTFTGQVYHPHVAGPVYSTAVVHLYNSKNRLIAMVPVETFPRRVHTNVPRIFTLQTDIKATDVQRYAFYINVSRVEEMASDGAESCPGTGEKAAYATCTPPTF